MFVTKECRCCAAEFQSPFRMLTSDRQHTMNKFRLRQRVVSSGLRPYVLRLLSPLSISSVYRRDCRDDDTPFTSTVPMTFWIGWIGLLLVISSIRPWNIHHRYDSCHLISLPKGLIRTTHVLHWIALPTLSLQYSLTLDPTP